MTHRLRIVSAVGPGDAVKAHDDWELGVRTPSETSLTFTSHEFEAFAALNASFWIVSSHPRAAIKLVGDSRIENRPRPEASGLAFHLSRARYAFSLLRSARAFRATHVIVDSGTTHWFCLMPFRLFGINVIPNLHNVLWVVGQPRSRRLAHRVAHALDRLFWRGVSTALACSPACSKQIQQMSGGRAKVTAYRAQFAAPDFDGLPRPVLRPTDDVRLMFAGRVEKNKGVFDLLAMARNLNTGTRRYVFEVCGHGSAFDQLAEEAKRANLGDRFLMRGKLARVELLEVYARAHLVIVPTRADFTEEVARWSLPRPCLQGDRLSRASSPTGLNPWPERWSSVA